MTATTVLTPTETGELGTLQLRHPPGTFAPSAATRVTLRAVAGHRDELAGTGVDWGCGVGALAIAAARVPSVDRVIGLDLAEANVAAARENARLNEVDDTASFFAADSYQPFDPRGREVIESLRGDLDFVVANPPASRTNDGFDFRRRVIREGAAMLRPGGVVLMQALSAYGPERVGALPAGEYEYEGIALRSDLVPLDFSLETMRRKLAIYVREERRRGLPYEFFVEADPGTPRSAMQVLAALRGGSTILGRWQVHRFRRIG